MEVRWSERATASARQYMRDQDGLRAVGVAVAALADDPIPPPPDGFHRSGYHRLHVGPYRVHYVIDGDVSGQGAGPVSHAADGPDDLRGHVHGVRPAVARP